MPFIRAVRHLYLRTCLESPKKAHLLGRAVFGILTVLKYSSGPCAPAPPNRNPFGKLQTGS